MEGRVHYEITADNSGFIRRANETRSAIDRTVTAARQSGLGLEGLFSEMEGGLRRLAKAGAAAFTMTKAAQFARDCIDVRANIQSLEISFETLLNSKDKADRMLGEIKTFAATTPMDLDTLAKGAQTMLSFNLSAEKIMPMLRSIGDISMGDAQKFESLTLAFSQMSSTGKLMGQDLLQMINAGFNPLAEISAKTGKSISDLKEDMEAGRITVKDVTEAFVSATSEGGKFHGMLEKQAEGLKGSFAYLRGSISGMMNEIGESAEGAVSKSVSLAGDLVKNYKEVGETLGVLVGMYGTYKTAVMVNAIVDMGTIGRLRKLVAAKQALIAIQAKLNAAMMANPYGMAAAAVVALTYAVYKLATARSDEEKALEQAEKAASAHQGEMIKELSTLDELKKKLEKAKKGTDEWNEAKKQIVSQFGKYNSELDNEISKTGTLTTSYEKLTKAIRMSAAARAMDDFEQNSGFSKDLDKNLEKVRKKLAETEFDQLDANGNKTGKRIVLSSKGIEQMMRQYYTAAETGNYYNMSEQARGYLTQAGLGTWSNLLKLQKRFKADREGKKNIAQRYGTSLEDLNNFEKPGSDETVDTDRSKEIEALIETKKKALKKLKKDSKEAQALTDEIDKLVAEQKTYGDYDRDHKTKSGLTAAQVESKEASAHQKLLDLIKQQTEERMKLRQEYEYQEWQNRIDLMDEGESKVLAQMRLDQKRERDALEEQKKQAIAAEIARQKAVWDAKEDEKAPGNKKYAKQVFNPETDVNQAEIKVITDRYDALNSQLLAKQTKADADRLKAAKEAFDNYLKEFGTYEEKRVAIAEEYDRKIAEAGTFGDKMQLQGQKHKALSDADFEQFKNSGDMSLAFGDVFGLTSETIKSLISDLEKYREKAIESFDPEKIREYNDALSGLREADIENSFGMFGDMIPEYFKQRISLQEQLNDKESEALITQERQKELQKQITDQRAKVTTLAVVAPDSDAYKKAVNELTRMEAEEDAAFNQSQKLNNEIKTLAERIKGLDGEAKFRAIAEAVADVAGLVGDLAGKASDMADALGEEGLGEALGYLGDAMGSVQNIASAFAQGGLIGGIAAAAGEVMNWITKLAMAGDARHQKNIERLQERIDALQKSYDRLGESAEKAYSTDASKMIDQQNTMLKQQQVLMRQQIAEEEAKKKTDKDKIKEWQEQIEEIDRLIADNKESAKEAIIGRDIKSAIKEFSSLYASSWEDGTDAAQKSMAAVKSIISGALTELLNKNLQPTTQKFYDSLAKAMEDGILTDAELANLDMLKSEMDAIAAKGETQYKKIQERYKDLDELREELTDISFDSVRDNFKSLLSDMESTTEDFTGSFTDMLRNALIEGLMDNKYDKMLKEWYDEFAEAMNDQKLTDSERDALRQQYDAIVQQGLADRNAVNAIVGGGAYSQQASKGEAWGMTQETGEELNGRFTAMVELEATNNTLVSDGNAIAREILATLRMMSGISASAGGDENGGNETLLAIKDMLFLSTGFLENIEKYSKHLASMAEDLSELKRKVKDL